MNMGGGEDYNNSVTSGTSKDEKTEVEEETIPSGDILSGSEKEKSTESTITEQNVSTAEASKLGDTTEGEAAANAPQITPQQNWEYEQSIKKEVEKTPLVCLTEDIQMLYQEYEQGSEVYRQKIMVCCLLFTHQQAIIC
jgi:hypothetical protein